MVITYNDSQTSYSTGFTSYNGGVAVLLVSDTVETTETTNYDISVEYLDSVDTVDTADVTRTFFILLEDSVSTEEAVSTPTTYYEEFIETVNTTEDTNYTDILVLIDWVSLNGTLSQEELTEIQETIDISDELRILSWWEELEEWFDRQDINIPDWTDRVTPSWDWDNRDWENV